jgi:hypothetical protein
MANGCDIHQTLAVANSPQGAVVEQPQSSRRVEDSYPILTPFLKVIAA